MKLTHLRWIYRGLIAFAAVAGLHLSSASYAQAQTDAPLGIYGGAGCDGVKNFNSFSTWLGRRPPRALEFLSWAALIQNSGWSMGCWSGAGVKDMTYSVPMLPEDGSATLAQGAAGQFDQAFRNLATTLVARGYPHAVIRIGWEFNGDWYSWAASKDPKSWIAYWRRIVGVMRSVPGAQFKFDWCPGTGWTPIMAQDVYPGDDVVDIIGLDAYNQSWNPNATTPELRWHDQVNGRHGLKWHADFAAAHGKPISFPEWGTGTREDGKGGGDDPLYIEQMAEWIASHRVAYHNYWNFSHPHFDGKLSDGSQPKAGAAFLKKFKLPRPKSPQLYPVR
jgi:hypothetical protein